MIYFNLFASNFTRNLIYSKYQYLWTYIFYFLSFICTLCNVWVHINCTYDIHYSNISSYTSDQKHELGQFLWLHIFIRHRVYRKPIHISSNNNNVQLKTFLYLFVFVTMFFLFFLYILGYITIQTKRNGGRLKLFLWDMEKHTLQHYFLEWFIMITQQSKISIFKSSEFVSWNIICSRVQKFLPRI